VLIFPPFACVPARHYAHRMQPSVQPRLPATAYGCARDT